MQNTLILNIGLAVSGKPDLLPLGALQAVLAAGLFDPSQRVIFKVAQSSTELTLCAAGTCPIAHLHALKFDVHNLAAALGQEAIAWQVLNPSLEVANQGLNGPNAAAWGDFDASQFIRP